MEPKLGGRRQARIESGLRWPKGTRGAGAAKGAEVHGDVGRGSAPRRSVTAKASRSRTERSAGARVVSQLQKSARSIFLASPRVGRKRPVPTAPGSAARELSP